MPERGISRVQIRDEQVSTNKLDPSLKNATYTYWSGNSNYVIRGLTPDAEPTGAAASFLRVNTPSGSILGQYKGGPHTILGPVMSATESLLNIAGDQTNDLGFEWVFQDLLSTAGVGGRLNHTVGTSAPAMVRASLKVEDVSGTDQLLVGFRKVENMQADWNSYDELAAISLSVATAAGDVATSTILNGVGPVNTDVGSDWGDNETHEFKVVIGTGVPGGSNAGRCRFYFDGVKVGADFVFDDGEVVTPFMFYLQAADLTQIYLVEAEAGFLKDFSDQHLY